MPLRRRTTRTRFVSETFESRIMLSATVNASIQPFHASFSGGVRVATGDVTGDGQNDVSSSTSQKVHYDPQFQGGVFVGV